jgi:hypothetical protein
MSTAHDDPMISNELQIPKKIRTLLTKGMGMLIRFIGPVFPGFSISERTRNPPSIDDNRQIDEPV